MEGILVVNKPSGMTSHDVVAIARRRFKMKRIGHAGTLDPLATGVLILLIGRSTKLFNKFADMDKAYQATLVLGRKTVSADIEGGVISEKPYDSITRDDVERVFEQFRGEIDQVPPMVSAVKHKGRKLYELARSGIEVERKARRIKIYRLNLEEFSSPYVSFFLKCSKGTYVRQIAEDVGERLGCGACISQIERTQVGAYSIGEAVTLEAMNEGHIQSFTYKESCA